MKKPNKAPTKAPQKLQSVKKPGPGTRKTAVDDYGLRPGRPNKPGQTAFPHGKGTR
ncbi:MAG: hypothetical protein GY719_10070 [bacterium]|nr:hypothetical protein [bacterium]